MYDQELASLLAEQRALLEEMRSDLAAMLSTVGNMQSDLGQLRSNMGQLKSIFTELYKDGDGDGEKPDVSSTLSTDKVFSLPDPKSIQITPLKMICISVLPYPWFELIKYEIIHRFQLSFSVRNGQNLSLRNKRFVGVVFMAVGHVCFDPGIPASQWRESEYGVFNVWSNNSSKSGFPLQLMFFVSKLSISVDVIKHGRGNVLDEPNIYGFFSVESFGDSEVINLLEHRLDSDSVKVFSNLDITWLMTSLENAFWQTLIYTIALFDTAVQISLHDYHFSGSTCAAMASHNYLQGFSSVQVWAFGFHVLGVLMTKESMELGIQAQLRTFLDIKFGNKAFSTISHLGLPHSSLDIMEATVFGSVDLEDSVGQVCIDFGITERQWCGSEDGLLVVTKQGLLVMVAQHIFITRYVPDQSRYCVHYVCSFNPGSIHRVLLVLEGNALTFQAATVTGSLLPTVSTAQIGVTPVLILEALVVICDERIISTSKVLTAHVSTSAQNDDNVLDILVISNCCEITISHIVGRKLCFFSAGGDKKSETSEHTSSAVTRLASDGVRSFSHVVVKWIRAILRDVLHISLKYYHVSGSQCRSIGFHSSRQVLSSVQKCNHIEESSSCFQCGPKIWSNICSDLGGPSLLLGFELALLAFTMRDSHLYYIALSVHDMDTDSTKVHTDRFRLLMLLFEKGLVFTQEVSFHAILLADSGYLALPRMVLQQYGAKAGLHLVLTVVVSYEAYEDISLYRPCIFLIFLERGGQTMHSILMRRFDTGYISPLSSRMPPSITLTVSISSLAPCLAAARVITILCVLISLSSLLVTVVISVQEVEDIMAWGVWFFDLGIDSVELGVLTLRVLTVISLVDGLISASNGFRMSILVSYFHCEQWPFRTRDNILLKNPVFSSIQPAFSGDSQIIVYLPMDATGSLSGSIKEKTRCQTKNIEGINEKGQLFKKDTEKMIQVAKKYKPQDTRGSCNPRGIAYTYFLRRDTLIKGSHDTLSNGQDFYKEVTSMAMFSSVLIMEDMVRYYEYISVMLVRYEDKIKNTTEQEITIHRVYDQALKLSGMLNVWHTLKEQSSIMQTVHQELNGFDHGAITRMVFDIKWQISIGREDLSLQRGTSVVYQSSLDSSYVVAFSHVASKLSMLIMVPPIPTSNFSVQGGLAVSWVVSTRNSFVLICHDAYALVYTCDAGSAISVAGDLFLGA